MANKNEALPSRLTIEFAHQLIEDFNRLEANKIRQGITEDELKAISRRIQHALQFNSNLTLTSSRNQIPEADVITRPNELLNKKKEILTKVQSFLHDEIAACFSAQQRQAMFQALTEFEQAPTQQTLDALQDNLYLISEGKHPLLINTLVLLSLGVLTAAAMVGFVTGCAALAGVAPLAFLKASGLFLAAGVAVSYFAVGSYGMFSETRKRANLLDAVVLAEAAAVTPTPEV